MKKVSPDAPEKEKSSFPKNSIAAIAVRNEKIKISTASTNQDAKVYEKGEMASISSNQDVKVYEKDEMASAFSNQEAKVLKANPKLQSFSDFLDEEMGPVGTMKRDAFQENYEHFKLGELIQAARLRKGLTQEQLADKIGMNKSYISRVENGAKDIRYSTMLKIITAMGARLHFTIE